MKEAVAPEAKAAPNAAKPKKGKAKVEGQREMLLPIAGKKPAAEPAEAEPEKRPTPSRRKAG